MADSILTAARLREVLHYNPNSGEFFWLISASNISPAGSRAALRSTGQQTIGVDGKRYNAQVLAWLYMTGEMPLGKVRYADGSPTNLKWENLVPAKRSGKDLPATQETIKSLLRYDSNTGLFSWRFSVGSRAQAGSIAGHVARQGYRKIKIGKTLYYAHRLAWLYMVGEWPENHIDHLNGLRDDNRWLNLRDVPQEINNQNIQNLDPKNTTGVHGVTLRKGWGKYVAQISVDNKNVYLGAFATPQDAGHARLIAERRHYPEKPVKA